MDYDPIEVRRMARENWSPSGSPRTKENMVNGRDKLRGVLHNLQKADIELNFMTMTEVEKSVLAALPLVHDLLEGYLIFERGPVDWVWDVDLEMHIPCCTQLVDWVWMKGGEPHKGQRSCGNGPLVGEQLRSGDCGEH